MSQGHIHFIVNPAAGRPAPILYHINQACADLDGDWEITVTKEGRAREAADQALSAGARRVVVYGGDGTIADVAGALIQTDVPLGIVPGGTANVLSAELNIPRDLSRALSIAVDPDAPLKTFDVGRINKHIFLLRVGFGLEAEIMRGADRKSKNVFGWLAYAFSGFSALLATKETTYEFRVDGKDVRRQGLGLIVANSGNVGLPGMSLFSDIEVGDGRLDVILIRPADIRLLADAEEAGDPERVDLLGLFERWSGKDIHVSCNPPQSIQYDGELLKEESADITVVPGAIRVVAGSADDSDPSS